MTDQTSLSVAELLERLSELIRDDAVYLGERPDGRNDENQYVSLLFRVPRGSLGGWPR